MAPRSSKPQHKVTKRVTKRAPTTTTNNNTNQPSIANDDASSPVYFWRETDPLTGYLSQWYPLAFTDDKDPSIVYKTAEHYMMYQKALLFSSPASLANEILSTPSPRDVRSLGRTVPNFTDEVWHAHRCAIVRRANVLKFTRPVLEGEDAEELWRVGGVSLREALLATGDREIVEASPRDRIWGIGFGAARAGSVRERWGLNLLGKALMEVRGLLREEEEEKEKEKEGEKEKEKEKEKGDESDEKVQG